MNEKFRAARYDVIRRRPYLSSAILACRVIETEAIPTFAITKYWTLLYNPHCLDKMTVQQGAAAIRHEIWHVLRKHSDRMQHLENIEKILISTDLEINDDDDLKTDLPDWCVFPHTYKLPEGKLAEEYYQLLPNPKGKCQNCGSGASGQPSEAEEGLPQATKDDPQPINPARAEVIRKRVAEEVKKAGNAAGRERLWADGILKGTQPDWKTLFKRLVRAMTAATNGMDDYTFVKINRRMEAYHPFIMPSMRTQIPKVKACLDTSGSMYGKYTARALGSIESMLTASGRHLTVICGDVEAYKPQSVRTVQQVQLDGGGGTDMNPLVEAANRVPGDITLVITDGEIPDMRVKCKTPILYCFVSESPNSGISHIPKGAAWVHIPVDQLK